MKLTRLSSSLLIPKIIGKFCEYKEVGISLK